MEKVYKYCNVNFCGNMTFYFKSLLVNFDKQVNVLANVLFPSIIQHCGHEVMNAFNFQGQTRNFMQL